MEVSSINNKYIYITIPVEYLGTYQRLIVLFSDYGEDMLKDCKAACKDRNSNIIDCLNMFNAAISARELGNIKLADTIIKYIDAKIIQINGGNVYVHPRPSVTVDTINILPSIVQVGSQAAIGVSVIGFTEIDNVVIYRDETEIFSSEYQDDTYNFIDIFTPNHGGEYTYKAVITRGEEITEISTKLAVMKLMAELKWSMNTTTVIIDGYHNLYPTLENPNGLTIRYESTNPNVATINADTGEISLASNGIADIKAIFTGNDMYEAETVVYTLNVENDAIVDIYWSNKRLEPATVSPGQQATLIKGTVSAIYKSGREVNVTDGSRFKADLGTVEGVIYTAPNEIGFDTIRVSYNDIISRQVIDVSVNSPIYMQTIYYGFANPNITGVSGLIPINKEVVQGTYSVTNDNSGNQYFMIIPESMNITDVTLDGFEFPMDYIGNVIVNNKTYKKYMAVGSDLGYKTGEYDFVVI